MKRAIAFFIFTFTLSVFAKTTDCANVGATLQAQAQEIKKKTAGLASVVKSFEEDIASIGGHACQGARENNYTKFILGMKKEDLQVPNAIIYEQATCGNGDLILQNTLLPHSSVFLKKFVVAIYKKYGKEEVAKIINIPERRFGYTLLEEAIVQNSCQEKSSSNISVIISYLKKVGGKKRPNFIEECKKTL